MDYLSTLPLEIVAEVWKYMLEPADIVNFAQVSKLVNGQASSALRRHNELIEKYSTFTSDEPWNLSDDVEFYRPSPDHRLASIVGKVLANPHIGKYIRKLHLQGWYDTWEPPVSDWSPEELKNYHLPHSNDDLAIFKSALSAYIIPVKLGSWISNVEVGDEYAMLGLLFLLAPNVQRIRICMEEGPQRLRNIIMDLKENSKLRCPATLARIKVFDLKVIDDEQPFEFIAFAVSMPSLQIIFVEDIVDYRYSYTLSWSPPGISSPKYLNFEEFAISIEELNELLQVVTPLDTVNFRNPSSFTDVPFLDPSELCTSLLIHAKASLKSLYLRKAGHEMSAESACITGLDGFDDLEDLDISHALIANNTTSAVSTEFPSGVQSIKVRDCQPSNILQLQRLVRDVFEAKVKRLPRLTTLALHIEGGVTDYHLSLFRPIQDISDRAGLSLQILDEVDEDWGLVFA